VDLRGGGSGFVAAGAGDGVVAEPAGGARESGGEPADGIRAARTKIKETYTLIAMLKNYLLLALRVIRRNKLYSLINVGCLAIGIAVAMTVMVYVLHEHSYDGWHKNAGRIFSVSTTEKYGGSAWSNYKLSYLTGPMVRQDNPAVESMVRVFPNMLGADLKNPQLSDTHFREGSDWLFADSNFFSFFSFRLLQGQAASVLARPFTVVLTKKAAKKYFGTANPIGKVLIMDDKYRMEVTGVAADLPSNSSVQFDLIASLSSLRAIEKYKPYLADQQVHGGYYYTWLLLRRPENAHAVEQSLGRLSARTEAKEIRQAEQGYGAQDSHEYLLLPLSDSHLKGSDSYSNTRYLDVFSLVAGLILLLALVNYMSLSTARSAIRAKEVGVRKVMGAQRSRIAGQFYVESTVYAVLSFLAGGLLFLSLRSYFFHLIDVPVDGRFIAEPIVAGSFIGLLVLVIVVSGSYPALVLSGFRPVAVLYGKMSRQLGGERVRKGFIVLQFTISMGLVVGSFVIGKQLYYMRHKEIGLDRENVVMLPFGTTMMNYGAYKQEVAELPAVRQVATAPYELFKQTWVSLVSIPGKAPIQLQGIDVDSTLIPLLGIKWKEEPLGKTWFDRKHMILNETAVQAFGLGWPATGKQVKVGEGMVTVAGVVKDFNFMSLHREIEPFQLTIEPDVDKAWDSGYGGCMYVKIGAYTNVPTVIDALRKIYKKFDNRTPFEYQFLDEVFDSNLKLEERLSGMVSVFTVITIVIACLGLFGLATFSAQQRMREIGIRKVLGASVASIGALLSKDFLRPVLLAILIACPVSWWVMHKWLEDFAYRTPLSWWVFAAAAMGLVAVALGTVLSRSLRAARANPVENLRAE
jgi:putative ABC transport system permease protein